VNSDYLFYVKSFNAYQLIFSKSKKNLVEQHFLEPFFLMQMLVWSLGLVLFAPFFSILIKVFPSNVKAQKFKTSSFEFVKKDFLNSFDTNYI
jgi:hypothetical protein